MSYLLFLDESGHDCRDANEARYEVLAGICVKDSNLWELTCKIHDCEEEHFGKRITAAEMELKAKKLLNRAVFKHAAQLNPIELHRRAQLAGQCIEKGSKCTKENLTALAQAKLDFVKKVLNLCLEHNVKAFASIVEPLAPRPENNFLRKDYSFLFERYYEFLKKQSPANELGIVVFDELERSQSHILIDQMSKYFRETYTGKQRSSFHGESGLAKT